MSLLSNYIQQPFHPLRMPNIAWYHDASNGVTTLENGISVDSWHDLSGNFFNGISQTSFSHLRASYLDTGLNEKPAIDFNTSDLLYPAAWGLLFSKTVPFTIFGKLRIDSIASTSQGILTSSFSTDDRFQIAITSNTQLNFAYWNGVTWSGLRAVISVNTDYWFIFQQHPGTITPRLWLNGIEVLTTTNTNAGVATNGVYVLGSVRQSSTVSQFDGKISKMGLSSVIESESIIRLLNNYLAAA